MTTLTFQFDNYKKESKGDTMKEIMPSDNTLDETTNDIPFTTNTDWTKILGVEYKRFNNPEEAHEYYKINGWFKF